MRIGIDIDGVLTNTEQFSVEYFSKYCVENDIEFNIGTSDYRLEKTFNVSEEYSKSFWDKCLILYAQTEKARLFASEIIKKLKDDGHEIFIITARWTTNQDDDAGKNMRGIVKKWLSENDITHDRLIFSKAEKEQKLQEIKDYKIDLMIEDHPKNINELSSIIPVICFNNSYNRECKGKNIIRCYSWYDIYSKIRSIWVG